MGDLPLRTPRHRRLGGPLPRQLANVPHAHPSPINLSSPEDASRRVYAVLDEISLDYPPVTGRLHTCYSPVRRSPADDCSPPLPLDLHVLSLSLAFILSQDQTLRCCILFFFFLILKYRFAFSRPLVYALFIVLPVELDGDVSFLSLCLVLHSIAIMSMSFVAPGFPRKRVQSYTLFHSPPNFFTTIFQTKLDKMPLFSLNTL